MKNWPVYLFAAYVVLALSLFVAQEYVFIFARYASQ